MSFEGQLRLNVVDVYGHPLTEPADIFLANRMIDHRLEVRHQNVTQPLLIRPLHTVPAGLYRLEVDAPSYLAVAEFVNITEANEPALTVTLPVNARRVIGLRAPAFAALPPELQTLLNKSPHVLDYDQQSGQDLYEKLDDVRKAGLLNLYSKASTTRFSNQRTVFSYISELIELRGDRFFAKVDHELRSQAANAINDGLVHEVSEALHTPTAGYERDRSFKTMDHYGNLQLSFFRNNNGNYALDMDIDDAQGFEHAFQVIGNTITGAPTHPYNIHEVLLAKQHLDTGYELLVRETGIAVPA